MISFVVVHLLPPLSYSACICITLNRVYYHDPGGAALAAVLIAHPSLTSVDLRRSEVADAQVAEIRKATARREVELRRERRKRFQNLGQAFESMHL